MVIFTKASETAEAIAVPVGAEFNSALTMMTLKPYKANRHHEEVTIIEISSASWNHTNSLTKNT